VTDQHHIVQVLILQHPKVVIYVSIESNIRTEQMCAVSESCEG
jgi:hypothetical protein